MQDPNIDYSLQRLSKMVPKHADDPDRLSKVKYMILEGKKFFRKMSGGGYRDLKVYFLGISL
jgi:hypothetical protein